MSKKRIVCLIISALIILSSIPFVSAASTDNFGVQTETNTNDATSDETYCSSALYGDANRDSKVNIKDATHIQKHLVDLVSISDEDLILCDVNQNGTVNIKDVTEIQKYIVGLISDTIINTPHTTEETTVITDPTEETTSVITDPTEGTTSVITDPT